MGSREGHPGATRWSARLVRQLPDAVGLQRLAVSWSVVTADRCAKISNVNRSRALRRRNDRAVEGLIERSGRDAQ